MSNMFTFQWPRIVKKPKGKTVVVLAPHMDDEIIGCAGTLCKHLETGDTVTVIYLTAGNRGTQNFVADKELSKRRKQEIGRSNAILGVQNTYFFDFDDGTSDDWSPAKGQLSDLLIRLNPDLVYIPPYYDLHLDHRKTNVLFKLAAQGKLSCTVCVYEVWTPVNPNILINITGQMDKKLQAISACQSQLESVAYDTLILGLNTYRGNFIFSKKAKYAEAFMLMPCQEYLQLFSEKSQALN